MPDKKLSQLSTGGPVAATDLFYSAQDTGGGTFAQVKQPASALATFLGPGGSNTQVQYNNAGAFGGAAHFTINAGKPDVEAGYSYMYDGTDVMRAQISKQNFWEGGAGNLTATGVRNLGTGITALASLTSGDDNTAVGVQALISLLDGTNNFAFGSAALANLDHGSRNTAVGKNSGLNLTSGSDNVAIGAAALGTCVTGSQNLAIGTQALTNCLTDQNAGIGNLALFNMTTGAECTVIGYGAGYQNISGHGFAGVGYLALYGATGGYNTGIGYACGYGMTTGAGNVLVGAAISGGQTQVTSGSYNVSIGYDTCVASATTDNQLCISNYIYGTGMDGRGTTISAGKVGFGIKAPAVELEVAGRIKTQAVLVANLPAAGNAGARSFVTDALGPVFGAIVAGAGAVKIPVYDDGTNWRVG